MSRDPSMTELNGFLAKHEPVAKPRLYDIGAVLGEWRVTAFLGSGGNAEVYRVVRVGGTSKTNGTSRTADTPVGRAVPRAPQPQQNDVEESVGALKVLLRDDAATRSRFAQETELLKANTSPSLPRFLDAGEVGRSVPDRRNHNTTKIALEDDCCREGTRGPTNNGRPYLVTELLEPVDLPTTEKDIANYLLAVCRAVGVLHHTGLIHRDIKPSNIMRRVNGELVLIDLGLVKDAVKTSEPERDVSIVAQKVIAVGTPRFAAPEQMTGGRVTAATDVHAIGRLADVAFCSQPPRSWLPVIRRATSSIPDQRYQTVDALAHAIRHRNDKRHALLAAAGVGAVALIVGVSLSMWRTTIKPHLAWQALCENTTKTLLVKELAWERLVTNKVGNSTMVVPERADRQIQKRTDVTMVRLNGQTNEFARPITLDALREYFIEGPGILSANFKAKGGTVRVHLKNCFLFNSSTVPIDKANIRYVFEGGAYLNFTNQDELPRSVVNAHVEEFDGAYDEIRFKGPTTIEGVEHSRSERNRAIMDGGAKTFFKNLHLPRHFFALRGKYVVEDMDDSIYKKYGIDPSRVPTDAEVELVSYCFDVDKVEAASILSSRKNPFLSKVSPLDLREDLKPKVKG